MRTLRLVLPLVLTMAGFAACSGGGLVPSDAGPVTTGGVPGSGGAVGTGGAGPGSGGAGLGGDGLGGDGGVAQTGGTDAGSGGTNGSGCARVHFLIQRSGAMFDYPAGEDSWWDALSEALDGDEGLLGEFGEQLELSATVFTKVQDETTCPIETSVNAPVGAGDLAELMADEKADFEELRDPGGEGGGKKIDAPVVEAVESATALLGDAENAHVVLLVSSIPDSCETSDQQCTVEQVFTAVQDAYAAGVATHVVYLSSDNNLPLYPEGLANAGAGHGIANTNLGCGTEFEYSDSPGNAPFGAPENTGALKQTLSELLGSIAASCN